MADHPILWFLGNMNVPLFTHSEVLELAGGTLTDDTLQNWANRKIVKPQIEGARRRYDTHGLAAVCLGNEIVKLGPLPTAAVIMVNQGLLLIMRNLKDTKKLRAKPGDVPLNAVHHFFCVYGPAGETPIIVDRGGLGEAVARTVPGCIAFAFGKMLVDLAKRAQKAADADRAVTVTGGSEEVRDYALAAVAAKQD